jgi:hypothetical protein
MRHHENDGRGTPESLNSCCKSSPLKTGIRTSNKTQAGPAGRGLLRNSRADLKVCTLNPADRMRRSVERRTDGSSSTTNTTGPGSIMFDGDGMGVICRNGMFKARGGKKSEDRNPKAEGPTRPTGQNPVLRANYSRFQKGRASERDNQSRGKQPDDSRIVCAEPRLFVSSKRMKKSAAPKTNTPDGFVHFADSRYATANDETVTLANVPALAFSEVMRDVDLFVGVPTIKDETILRQIRAG